MAPRKKTVAAASKVCVLALKNGENLILRSNPSEEEVRSFIEAYHMRYDEDSPERIMSGTYFDSEWDIDDLSKAGAEIDIASE